MLHKTLVPLKSFFGRSWRRATHGRIHLGENPARGGKHGTECTLVHIEKQNSQPGTCRSTTTKQHHSLSLSLRNSEDFYVCSIDRVNERLNEIEMEHV